MGTDAFDPANIDAQAAMNDAMFMEHTAHPTIPGSGATTPTPPEINTNPTGNPLGTMPSEINIPAPHAAAAQGMIEALQKSDGGPAGWAQAAISGVTGMASSLAGVGNIGKVPAGAGPLYGIGKVMQYNQEQKQAAAKEKADQDYRNKSLALDTQREQDEQTYQKYMMAQATAKDTRDAAFFNKQMQVTQHEIDQLPMKDALDQLTLDERKADFAQGMQSKIEADQQAGYTRAQIGGQDTPEFDNSPDGWAQASKYAQDNFKALHKDGFYIQPRYDYATGKVYAAQAPIDTISTPQWFGAKKDDKGNVVFKDGAPEPDGSVKGPDGKPHAYYAKPAEFHALMDQQLDEQEKKVTIYKTGLDAQKDLQEIADQTGAATALGELAKNGGDVSKITDPTQRRALLGYLQSAITNLNASAKAAHDAGDDEAAEGFITQAQPFHQQINSLLMPGGGAPPPAAAPAAGSVDAAVQQTKANLQAQSQQKVAAKQTADDQQLVSSYTDYDDLVANSQGAYLPAPKNYDAIMQGLQQHPKWSVEQKAQYIRQVSGGQAQPQQPSNVPPRPAGAPANYVYSATGPHGPGYYDPALLK